MNKLFGLFLLALAILAPVPADAACSGGACFWITGTGTVDGTSDNGKWSLTSGGASCACVPAVGDTVTFDGSSGGGTVTVNMGGALWTVSSFSMAAFTGTIDFATNNNSLTITGTGGFGASGASTKTLNMGSGTFTLSAANASVAWDTSGSGLTLNAGTSTIAFTGTFTTNTGFRRLIAGTGKTYANVSVAAGGMQVGITASGTNTFGTITLNAPAKLYLNNSLTYNVTTFSTVGATASNPIFISNEAVDTGNRATISSANNFTCNFCSINFMAFTGGGTFVANNSFGYNNNGITVNGPTPSGGGRIIGG